MNVIMLLNNGFAPDLRVYKEAKYLYDNDINIQVLCLDRKNEYIDKPEEIYKEVKIKRFFVRTEKTTNLINKSRIISKFKYFIYLKWLLKYVKQVKKYVKDLDFEILHCHDLEMAFCGVVFFRNKKIVFDMHEYYSEKKSKVLNWLIDRVVRFVQKRSTWIIHVNDFQVKNIKQREKLVFVPNYPQVYKFKNLNYKPADKLRISYTGYVSRYLPTYNLMCAANELDNIEVSINGDGPFYEELKEKSKDMKNITMTGKYNHDDIAKFYENSDILYCVYNKNNPNDATAIPTKFYEALISGSPLIVAKDTAMSEFVEKYDIGFCVNGEDKEDIKNTILNIQNNFNVLAQKRENVKKISNDYTWENIVTNLNKIYIND